MSVQLVKKETVDSIMNSIERHVRNYNDFLYEKVGDYSVFGSKMLVISTKVYNDRYKVNEPIEPYEYSMSFTIGSRSIFQSIKSIQFYLYQVNEDYDFTIKEAAIVELLRDILFFLLEKSMHSIEAYENALWQ
jgi:hypothetical protein